MSRFASILIPSSEPSIQVATLGSHAASTAVKIGAGRIFVINADQDINISFGAAATISAPDGTFYRIPANQQTTFDMGSANDTIQLYNLSATTAANVYIMRLSVM